MPDERVEAFVSVLTKASKRRRQEVPETLVQHTRHCLTTLIRKQASLETALQVLGRHVWPAVVQGIRQGRSNKTPASDDKSSLVICQPDIPKVLEHVFTQLLRLHDGLILLVSGECRHQGDIDAPKPFATRLTQNARRADGYTQLYKATSVYSGASHDEWFDERNGLLTAWRTYLGPKFWEQHLLEKYAILEALMSDVETKMQQLQHEFLTLSQRLTADLQRLFPDGRHIKLSLQDQMERFTVDPWSWERRGKNFQWKDPLGILPAGWTARQWQESLSWEPTTRPQVRANTAPTNVTRKRRRVIEDDDDEDNDEGDVKVPAKVNRIMPEAAKENPSHGKPLAEGLKIKTKASKPKTNKDTVDSLNTIKAQMGVNVHALQQSREGLEAEEQVTRASAQAVDQSPVDADEEDEEQDEARQRQASVRRVKELTKQLLHMEQRSTDMYDVWDARECLRRALMEAGNMHLWSSHENNADNRLQLLRQADDYFKQALQLVQAQKELHGRMVAEASATEELKMCRRNLLLLQAQALVNRGIAQVEQGQRKYIVEAIQLLEGAQKECRVLGKAAETDRSNGSSALETTLDSLFARETGSLALRWKAEAMWKLGKKTEAISIFTQAGNTYKEDFDSPIPLTGDREMFRTYLSFRTESYYAWVRLIDLLALDAQRSPGAALSQTRWESLQTHLKSAFSAAAQCSCALKRDVTKFGDRLSTFFAEQDVLEADDLLSAEETLVNDLTNRRDISAKSLSSDSRAAHKFGRSDVVDSATLGLMDVPSRWLLTGNEKSRQRRRQKRYGAGYSNIRVPDDTVDERPTAGNQGKQRYRLWGDDLFPKKRDESGNLVPDLPFPFCAPDMPPAIRAILEQHGVLGSR